MVPNPYESPRELGYGRPTQRSRWWDFIACVAMALLIHAVIQAAGQMYRILELDWTSPLRPWRGHLIAIGQFVFIAFVAFIIFCLALARWRKQKRKLRLDIHS